VINVNLTNGELFTLLLLVFTMVELAEQMDDNLIGNTLC
jgi:hypothetical protein